jgi:phosphate/sulfate permease
MLWSAVSWGSAYGGRALACDPFRYGAGLDCLVCLAHDGYAGRVCDSQAGIFHGAPREFTDQLVLQEWADLTGLGLALSQGTNDAQKAMGIITMGLVASGMLSSFEVPLWVVALSAGALAAGTATGGWGMIRTLGGKFYKIRPVNGFCAQVGAASVLLGAALLGGPVSSTQVVSSTIAGVGAAERMSKVRWGVLGNIAIAWILTIPATGSIAALAFLLLNRIF